jgi:Domain of unknown function (DUF4803)
MYYFMSNTPTNDTIEDFANSIVQIGNLSVLNQMNEIRTMLRIDNEPRVTSQHFMENFVKYLQRSSENRLCHLTTSPQQILFDLLRKLYYGEVAALELFGYAYAVKAQLKRDREGTREISDTSEDSENTGPKEFTAEKALARKNFEEYGSMIQSLMQYYMPKLERTYWKCDAKAWHRGVTFHELNRMLYGIVEYEYDLGNTCSNNCAAFSTPHPVQRMDMRPEYKCSGYVSECTSSTAGQFKFCFSNSEVLPEMYSYIQSDMMNRGAEEECQDQKVYKVNFIKNS